MYRRIIALLLALSVMLTLVGCRKKKMQKSETTEAAMVMTEAKESSEETTEALGFANEAIAGEPAPFDDKTAEIIPGITNVPKKSQTGNRFETLPPDVDLSLDIEEGEEAEDVWEDIDAFPIEEEGSQEITEPADTASPTPTIAPSQPITDPAEILGSDFDITKLTYESYNAMTGEQQMAVIAMFGSPEDFMRWYKAVEALYLAEHSND